MRQCPLSEGFLPLSGKKLPAAATGARNYSRSGCKANINLATAQRILSLPLPVVGVRRPQEPLESRASPVPGAVLLSDAEVRELPLGDRLPLYPVVDAEPHLGPMVHLPPLERKLPQRVLGDGAVAPLVEAVVQLLGARFLVREQALPGAAGVEPRAGGVLLRDEGTLLREMVWLQVCCGSWTCGLTITLGVGRRCGTGTDLSSRARCGLLTYSGVCMWLDSAVLSVRCRVILGGVNTLLFAILQSQRLKVILSIIYAKQIRSLRAAYGGPPLENQEVGRLVRVAAGIEQRQALQPHLLKYFALLHYFFAQGRVGLAAAHFKKVGVLRNNVNPEKLDFVIPKNILPLASYYTI
uniref:Uncharacterized protein n=2 Tax=Spironucleus salmonicida TaxID=348837 RepID=V6LSR5_9EUKA|eukprot:EST46726.1 Hypothetical protein SS50377_13240 [Spironucleus salmonicida]